MITASQVAKNQDFQDFALIESMKTLSKSTNISVAELIEQFPTNAKLQETCAKMVLEAAEDAAEMLNEAWSGS